jgi:hypothetical protein
MVATLLTDEMVRWGAELVGRLDERGYSPDAAFWFHLPDTDEWKLVLAETKFSQEGPKAAYQVIQQALPEDEETKSLTLDVVAVTSPQSPLVSLLASAIRTGHGISGIRFTNNVISGTVVDDAYIYRLDPPVVQSNR